MLLELAAWLQKLSPELGYFRVFQYGKLVPSCHRAVRL